MTADTQTLVKIGFNPIQSKLLSDNGGWTPVDSDRWVQASASTITVPTDATLRFGKGMKLRLKQGAGYKYFYIIGVAATTLTVTGGSDYTVADAAITDMWYSYFESPLGFPGYFNYLPTVTVNGGVATFTLDKNGSLFSVSSNCKVSYKFAVTGSLTTGGSPGTASLLSTLPISPSIAVEGANQFRGVVYNDGTWNAPSEYDIPGGWSAMRIFKRDYVGLVYPSATNYLQASGEYYF